MIPTMISSIAIPILFAVLFISLSSAFKKLDKKIDILLLSSDFVQNDIKTRNAEYKARKEWKTYREKNLPKHKEGPRIPRSPMSSDEMTRKADILEKELQR